MIGALLTLLATAQAAGLSPDRPGVGESTSTPGPGALVVEGGLQSVLVDAGIFGSFFQLGTDAITGRYGIGERLEARLLVPDVVYSDSAGGGVAVGTVAVGAKVAHPVSDTLAVSAVPSVGVTLNTGTPEVALSLNGTWDAGPVSPWVNITPALSGSSLGAFFGGGLGVPLGPAGLFGQGGVTDRGDWMAGGGGWLGLSDELQLDLGATVEVLQGLQFWQPGVGMSAAF